MAVDVNEEYKAGLVLHFEREVYSVFRQTVRGIRSDPRNIDLVLGGMSESLRGAARSELSSVAVFGSDYGYSLIEEKRGTKSIKAIENVNEAAVQWAAQYSGTLIRNIDETTRSTIRALHAEWIVSGKPIGNLVAHLTGDPSAASPSINKPLSRHRARRIAVTETTKAFSEGNLLAWREEGRDVFTGTAWRTANDEYVCPVCAPLGGMTYGEDADAASEEQQERRSAKAGLDNTRFVHPGGSGRASRFRGDSYDPPPAHVSCRCWMVPY